MEHLYVQSTDAYNKRDGEIGGQRRAQLAETAKGSRASFREIEID